jgi:hypothetical protein
MLNGLAGAGQWSDGLNRPSRKLGVIPHNTARAIVLPNKGNGIEGNDIEHLECRQWHNPFGRIDRKDVLLLGSGGCPGEEDDALVSPGAEKATDGGKARVEDMEKAAPTRFSDVSCNMG